MDICSINIIGIELNQRSSICSCDKLEAAFGSRVEPNRGALKQKIHSFSGKACVFLDCSIKKKLNFSAKGIYEGLLDGGAICSIIKNIFTK